jgi:hypothetical protein
MKILKIICIFFLCVFVHGLLTNFVSSGAQAEPAKWVSNDHWYDVVDAPGINWFEANAASSAQQFNGLKGHLVTITSDAENQFLVDTFGTDLGDRWIGAFQTPGAPEPDGGWTWITGEFWDYTNWYIIEPNNAYGHENAIHLYREPSLAQWNDYDASINAWWIPGFVIEYEPTLPDLILHDTFNNLTPFVREEGYHEIPVTPYIGPAGVLRYWHPGEHTGAPAPSYIAFDPSDGKFGGGLAINYTGDPGGGCTMDVVAYPIGELMNPNEGAIELWYKPHFNQDDGSADIYVIGGFKDRIDEPDNVNRCAEADTRSSFLVGPLSWTGWRPYWYVDIKEFDGADTMIFNVRSSTMAYFNADEWMHFGIVWKHDGIDAIDGKTLILFINGEEAASSSVTFNPQFPFQKYLIVGGSRGCSFICNTALKCYSGASGDIDNLKVWSYAKTDFSDRFWENGLQLRNINKFVTFEPDSSTYSFTPDTADCQTGAVGKFSFNATLTNISEKDLSNLFVEINTLTNGNMCLTDDGLMGVGERFEVPKIDDYVDGILRPEENVDVPFTVCLKNTDPFRFFVDVVGVAAD